MQYYDYNKQDHYVKKYLNKSFKSRTKYNNLYVVIYRQYNCFFGHKSSSMYFVPLSFYLDK